MAKWTWWPFGEKSEPKSQVQRGKWGNKVQFILSCVGFSVGLGNVRRFSHLAYRNGGGAFLIPYIISVVLSGLPLYVLELALGQFSSLGPTKVFSRISPLFRRVGWAVVIVTFNITIYYNVVIAWSIYYLVISFSSELPWIGCNKTWTTAACVSSIEDNRCKASSGDDGSFYFNRSCYPGVGSTNAKLMLSQMLTTPKVPTKQLPSSVVGTLLRHADHVGFG